MKFWCWRFQAGGAFAVLSLKKKALRMIEGPCTLVRLQPSALPVLLSWSPWM